MTSVQYPSGWVFKSSKVFNLYLSALAPSNVRSAVEPREPRYPFSQVATLTYRPWLITRPLSTIVASSEQVRFRLRVYFIPKCQKPQRRMQAGWKTIG